MTLKKLLLPLLFLLNGCGDSGEVFVYDKNVKHLDCLSLLVFPPSKVISDSLKSKYKFSYECKNELVVSYKNSITCNSNQNADKKAKGLPKSYIRLEIKKDGNLVYTYYKDLNNNITKDDVLDGFEHIEKDLLN